jgi:hypothetical protein
MLVPLPGAIDRVEPDLVKLHAIVTARNVSASMWQERAAIMTQPGQPRSTAHRLPAVRGPLSSPRYGPGRLPPERQPEGGRSVLRGKSDPLEAVSAARRALAGQDRVIPKDTTTTVEAIRVLRIARSRAVKSRTAAYNQLKDLILTAPDELRKTLRGKSSPRSRTRCRHERN